MANLPCNRDEYMTKLTKDEIKTRRAKVSVYPIHILAEELGYTVKKVGRNYMSLQEHDSVMIKLSTNTFEQYSSGRYGDTLAFLMCLGAENTGNRKFNSLSYSLAYLEKKMNFTDKDKLFKKKESVYNKKELVLPLADETNNQVVDYLRKRHISNSIINQFIEKKMLYQEKDWKKNCIFVSYDDNNCPVYAVRRSSNFRYRFVGDIEGSDYTKGFFINNDSDTLVVTEAVIEAMSLMTLKESDLGTFNSSSFYCMNSINKIDALINTLQCNKKINLVILSLNNDEPGRKATEKIKEIIHTKIPKVKVWVYLPDKDGYDWNDTLTEKEMNA